MPIAVEQEVHGFRGHCVFQPEQLQKLRGQDPRHAGKRSVVRSQEKRSGGDVLQSSRSTVLSHEDFQL